MPMPSSLEIAQTATLRPVAVIAEEMGLLPDEIELFGRYKAKIGLAAIDRLADRPDGLKVIVTAVTPTPLGKARRRPRSGSRRASTAWPQGGSRAAPAFARSGVRHQGWRCWRWLQPGPADGHRCPDDPLATRPGCQRPRALSHDPSLKGRPTGWRLPNRDARLFAGAGFVTAYCGNMMTMPGLPTHPAGEDVDIDADGRIVGLF